MTASTRSMFQEADDLLSDCGSAQDECLEDVYTENLDFFSPPGLTEKCLECFSTSRSINHRMFLPLNHLTCDREP